MWQSIKQVCSDRLGAFDGEIGHIKDFYFDDMHWAIRYLVAETGAWLSDRQVLISPLAFGGLYQGEKVLKVNLTRKQIEDSPSIDSHKPISRRYEAEYHEYYGWPKYWQGDSVGAGMRDFPVLSEKLKLFSASPAFQDDLNLNSDIHLHSAIASVGYHIQASNGTVGELTDFLMNDKTWAIEQLVLIIHGWLSGKHVLLPTNRIRRINADESKIFMTLPRMPCWNCRFLSKIMPSLLRQPIES